MHLLPAFEPKLVVFALALVAQSLPYLVRLLLLQLLLVPLLLLRLLHLLPPLTLPLLLSLLGTSQLLQPLPARMLLSPPRTWNVSSIKRFPSRCVCSSRPYPRTSGAKLPVVVATLLRMLPTAFPK